MNFIEKKEEIFYEDGTLRDICLEKSEKIDWYKIILFLEENNIKYLLNGKKDLLENNVIKISDYFNDIYNKTLSLKFFIDKIQINGFFMLGKGDIFDINPSEINTEEDCKKLYSFLSGINKILGKKLYITDEGNYENKLDFI